MKNSRGYTLLELLIAFSVAGVAGIMLISLWTQNNSLFLTQQAHVSQGLNLNDLTFQIKNDIKSADAIASGYPLTSPTITSSANSLVLSIPSIDSTDNIIIGKSDYITFYADPTNPKLLKREIFVDPVSSRPPSTKILTTTLSSIIFQYFDETGNPVTPTTAKKINFQVDVIEKTSGFKNEKNSVQGEVNLRND